MRWLLATVVVLVSSPPAFADQALPSRPLDGVWTMLPEPAPVSFDLVDFRLLMARHPDLAETIDAEAKRRALENK